MSEVGILPKMSGLTALLPLDGRTAVKELHTLKLELV